MFAQPLVKNYLWVPCHATILNVKNFLRKKLQLEESAQVNSLSYLCFIYV
jgi:hypothetical protein